MPKKIRLPLWISPFALLGLCVLGFGLMIADLGYHWDDWTIAWYLQFMGSESFQQAYSVDRPLLAGVMTLTTNLIGSSPAAWQIFAIFTRWLSCLALWWTLQALWPNKTPQNAGAAALFTIYPGFQQQYIAITYGNGFLVLAISLFSLGAMLWALRKPRWFWPLYILSFALSTYAMFVTEYFFGQELLRPILLWIVLSERITDWRMRLRQISLYWAPYLLSLLSFLAWRLTTPTPRADVVIFQTLLENPIRGLLGFAATVFQDIYKVSLLAWSKIFDFSIIQAYPQIAFRKYLFIVIGAALLIGALTLLSKIPGGEQPPKQKDRNWGLQAASLGLAALLFGGIPIWSTDLRFELFFPWDRFNMSMALGVSLLITGLIDLATRVRWQSAIVIGALVGLAAGMHFQIALTYREEWLSQRDFFWQMTWRMPDIQPGTTLLTTEMPFLYNTDNSFTAPLNWTYAPDLDQNQLPYLMYNMESRLSRGLEMWSSEESIEEHHRITPFYGSADQAIYIFYRPPGCLQVFDPAIHARIPYKPRFFQETLPLSRPELILTQANPASQPPLDILGPEPEHTWCYYFEKADLARQVGDWETIAALGDQAQVEQKKFYRVNVTELLPFIEGYARLGEWEKAVRLTLTAFQTWENMNTLLCERWGEIVETSQTDPASLEAVIEALDTLQCQAP